MARGAGIEPGVSVLDVGCGSGEFCELAAAPGARVSGIDAAKALIEFARRRVSAADLRIGPIEQLPWPDKRPPSGSGESTAPIASRTGSGL